MRLTEGFQLLATAPEGMTRLRKLIFSLAVMGKLVPQEQTDEPARVLLQEIRAEKNRRIATGTIKAEKPSTEIDDKEKPFSLPANWEWVRFGNVSINRDGERVPVSSADREKRAKLYDYYGASGVIDKIDGYLFDKTLLLIGEDGANLINRSTPIAFLATGKYWVNNHAHVVDATHDVVMQYLCLFINAISLEPYVTGTAQPKMNQAKLNDIVVALPPLKEQSRIVAKVDELMRLCDELEAHGRLEAEHHTRLTATLFDALAASESPHELAENWARVAAHFDLLLDRPEAVDALEQIIVHLAVRGLLVPQVPNDEPASELLQRVRQEKDRLIAEGTIRRDKPLQQVDENSLPYEAPNGWMWARFGAVILDSEAGWSPSCENVPRVSGQWGVLKVSAVSWGKFRPDENKELPAGVLPKPEYEVMSGDFLLSRANTDELVARSVVVEATEPKLMMSDKIIRLNLSALVDSQYLNLFNNSVISRGYYVTHASGTSSSMKNVSREVILNLPVALPPAVEQSRIVARVQELRGLCANLRDRFIARQACQARLAEAIVGQNGSAAVPSEDTDGLAAAA